ncbi:unnamed protein product [Protopolystoma xenopodis]|uniref:Uncharacterized protein n=1 Tax=Protopolystoma xenopodis TaxID=117903 RepID=A0A448WCQ0_9PLAT|nr:unnamed protein product [Protopolystoma xenopodis]
MIYSFAESAVVSLPRPTNANLLLLAKLHPLPRLVVEWRRIHGILEKSFSGLVNACCLAEPIHPQESKSHSEKSLFSIVFALKPGFYLLCLPGG